MPDVVSLLDHHRSAKKMIAMKSHSKLTTVSDGSAAKNDRITPGDRAFVRKRGFARKPD